MELTVLKKAYSSQKNALVFRRFLGFREDKMHHQASAHYFFYVGVARWVAKLFRIEEEIRKFRQILTGGSSFKKIWYILGKSLLFYENHSISAENANFCEKDARFQKGGVIFARKKTEGRTPGRWQMYMFNLGWYFRGSRMARMRPSSKVNMTQQSIAPIR